MELENIYPDLGSMLDPTDKAVNYDKKQFGRWEDGRISTRTCWTRFKRNNNIGKRYRFNEEWFEAYLHGLGYYQGGGYGRED